MSSISQNPKKYAKIDLTVNFNRFRLEKNWSHLFWRKTTPQQMLQNSQESKSRQRKLSSKGLKNRTVFSNQKDASSLELSPRKIASKISKTTKLEIKLHLLLFIMFHRILTTLPSQSNIMNFAGFPIIFRAMWPSTEKSCTL